MKKQKSDTQKLLESAVSELHFANLQISHLMSILNELEVVGDELTKSVVKNGKERHYLDQLIHAKKVIGNI